MYLMARRVHRKIPWNLIYTNWTYWLHEKIKAGQHIDTTFSIHFGHNKYINMSRAPFASLIAFRYIRIGQLNRFVFLVNTLFGWDAAALTKTTFSHFVTTQSSWDCKVHKPKKYTTWEHKTNEQGIHLAKFVPFAVNPTFANVPMRNKKKKKISPTLRVMRKARRIRGCKNNGNEKIEFDLYVFSCLF